MIRITQLKLPVTHTEEDLKKKILHTLHIRSGALLSYRIARRSIDAREREGLLYVYTVEASVRDEAEVVRHARNKTVSAAETKSYRFPPSGSEEMSGRPIIVGSGPAGLFCGYLLAYHGYRPLILERGDAAPARREKIDHFWVTGELDADSNVQFGEGGAGTFSDGKLNTGVKDRNCRNREVLRIFVDNGAPEDILWDARPHLGTDLLVDIVVHMRKKIEEWGGEVLFRTKVSDLIISSGKTEGVRTEDGRIFSSRTVVLAIGHSARDTFVMLSDKPLAMEAKPFAVGVRIQHPQELINRSQYGEKGAELARCPEKMAYPLPAASYRLARTLADGRGVYSFCMCPGGWVVDASSEEGRLAVNGMSYRARDGENANSAIVVSVTPEDFRPFHRSGTREALDGIFYQRHLEEAAFRAGHGCIPVQRYEDFCEGRAGGIGSVRPCIRGRWETADVRSSLPEYIGSSLALGIGAFGHSIRGFDHPDALIAGVESRTSSPVRILRGKDLESTVEGLYPCGEGAGYAGGITSAAMDGIRVAEKIASRYAKLDGNRP